MKPGDEWRLVGQAKSVYEGNIDDNCKIITNSFFIFINKIMLTCGTESLTDRNGKLVIESSELCKHAKQLFFLNIQ